MILIFTAGRGVPAAAVGPRQCTFCRRCHEEVWAWQRSAYGRCQRALCVNIGGCGGYVDDAECPHVAEMQNDDSSLAITCHYSDLCVPVPLSGIQADVISFNTALGALEVIQTYLNVVHVCSDRKVDSLYESLWCWSLFTKDGICPSRLLGSYHFAGFCCKHDGIMMRFLGIWDPFLWGLPARHRVIGSYLLACWRHCTVPSCLVVKGNFLIVDASFDILNNLEHGHWKIIRTTSLTLRISTIPLCWAVIGFRIRHVEDIFGMVNAVVLLSFEVQICISFLHIQMLLDK